MIYFITNHEETLKYYLNKNLDNILVLKDNLETFNYYKEYLNESVTKIIGFDKEANGLDAWVNSSILDVIGDEDNQFILHSPYSDSKRYIEFLYNNNFTLLGHNIKYDLKLLLTELKIWYYQVYDTMIAEQRLYMKLGLSNSLENLMIRYLNEFPKESDKNIRNEFIGVNIKTFIPKLKHLKYAAGDVNKLFIIKEQQEVKIEEYNLKFLIKSIEFPLISILAKAEIEGIDFNLEAWLEIAKENKEKKVKIEHELDEEFRRIREEKFKNLDLKNRRNLIDKLAITGGMFDNPRKENPQNELFNSDGTTNSLDLFGEYASKKGLTNSKSKYQENPNNINYGSSDQICTIFGRLGEPLPITNTEKFAIPSFKPNGKLDKKISFTTKEDALTLYLVALPNSIMKTFLEKLLDQREYSTAIKTFGDKYKSKINKVTGKLHTIFGQCFTATGRMSSGGGRTEPDKPNFQNIPSRAEYAKRMRNCFIANEGYSIGTHDYSGAELIVMCSLAQDMKLLELSKGDMHSYFAQLSWRNVFKHRAWKRIQGHENLRKKFGKEYRDENLIKIINQNIQLSKTYIVSKQENEDKRTDMKPQTFGTIYGMQAPKATQTLKLNSIEEGALVINTIKAEIPATFEMVETASKNAKKHGYLVLNTRTNSRAWFPTIMAVLKGERTYKDCFISYNKEANEARNIRIQGTQADFIKEATVNLQRYINKYNLDVIILMWVHDEIVDKHPNYLNGKSEEWEKWIIENPDGLTYRGKKGLSFPEVKKLIMIDTANMYLENITIDVDYKVEPYWTK